MSLPELDLFACIPVALCAPGTCRQTSPYNTFSSLPRRHACLPQDLVKNWFWSYAGNLVGSLLLVGLVAGSGLLAASGVPAAMAVAKTSIPFGQVRKRRRGRDREFGRELMQGR